MEDCQRHTTYRNATQPEKTVYKDALDSSVVILELGFSRIKKNKTCILQWDL